MDHRLLFAAGIGKGLPYLIAAVVVVLVVAGAIRAIVARVRRTASGSVRQWLRARLGRGLGADELARRLDMPAEELHAFEPVYHQVYIAKRRGGRRLLCVPDPRTKALQRRLLRRVLRALRAHPAACGFERGRSIVDNALPHVGRAVVVRMDIVDFFPSTAAERIEKYFRRVGWDKEAAAVLTKLTTYDDGLPQGAPTSPRLSNLVNYYLDVQLSGLARRRKGVYTRYADDITFSFPRDAGRRVRGVIQTGSRTLKSKGYQMHARRKLHVRRRHQCQRVTGLVVNDKAQLPRRTRRWLRALRHRLAAGRETTLSDTQLQGWLAFEAMVKNQTDVAGAP